MNNDIIEKKFLANKNLIYYILKKYFLEYFNDEDMFQVGSIGLLKAIRTFDESKGYKFSTYASKIIYNEIGQEIRKINRLKKYNIISYDQLIYNEIEDSNLYLKEKLLSYKDENFNDFEFQDLLKNIYEELNNREKIIFAGLLNGISQHKLKNVLHISQAQCSRIQKKILNKIREDVIAIYA